MRTNTLTIPELALVALIGVSGSGKSTFARKHFKATEVLSSDFCRGLVADDTNDQTATNDAFDVLYYIAAKRLAAGRLTVIDATNVQREARKSLVSLAREYHCLPVAIVLNLPEKLCQQRNKARPDRDFGQHVVQQQSRQLHRSLRGLKKEGFRHVFVLSTEEEVESASLERQPLWNNRRHESGPFDIIGDVHGCLDELVSLLTQLGYVIEKGSDDKYQVTPPDNRTVVFLGDIVDRGPSICEVLRLIMSMVGSGVAHCVPGNHDMKLVRHLRGKNVLVNHGLEESIGQLGGESEAFKESVASFLDGLVSHYVFDEGRLVVAHAGMKETLQGRGSGKVRDFALYGETTGETDEFGLPVRFNWASEYRGQATVVYGHTPVPKPEWVNNTVNIDTGCVFGGALTALRYPEKEFVSVPAAQTYCEPVKPLASASRPEDLLDIGDVLGKRVIETRLRGNITVREEQANAALEVISRFATDPRWLVYLPPTMSPSETSSSPGLLEHPDEAFAYFRSRGISTVMCQKKHMGSRAIIVVCKDSGVAEKRFNVTGGEAGTCYTRTGRRFFDDPAIETALLDEVRNTILGAGLWDSLHTDWLCLDCELMPWSVKAQELLRTQYAAVGSASTSGLAQTVKAIEAASARGVPFDDAAVEGLSLLDQYKARLAAAHKYVEAYRHYCWPVRDIRDLKLAPFHVLAGEGQVFAERDHRWHMDTIESLCGQTEQGMLMATTHREVNLEDAGSVAAAVRWWEELTAGGGEGMVVKPLQFIAHGKGGLIQPALKCRGREYLRIIYGPEYTAPKHLERLRKRNLRTKRSLALREFALGIESLDRLVNREPLYRVHECVLAVLAMESEPVDPRL